MIDALAPIETVVTSQTSTPEDVARALAELGRLLDPLPIGTSRESTQMSVQLLGRAVDMVAGVRPRAEGPELAECLFSIAKCAYFAGHAVKGLAPAQRAVELCRCLEVRAPLQKALLVRGALLADSGNQPLAIEAYAEALEIAIELRDPIAEGKVFNNLGAALINAAQFRDAIACLERVVTVTEGNDEHSRTVRGAALANVALACLHLEDYARGLRAAKASVELLDNPVTALERLARVLAETHYARLLLEVDAPETARERCESAKRFAHESGLERAELEAGMAEGLCEVYSGKVDIGLSRLSRWLDQARVLKATLGDALTAMVKANELANRHEVALVYLHELMMHTKQVQLDSALLHHRLHLEQLEQRAFAPSSPDVLMAQRDVKLRNQLVQRVAHQELMKARVEILERLAVTADLRSDATGEHSYRVGKLAALLAQELGWDEDIVFLLELAARLHDIGKIGLPEGILPRKGRLNEADLELAQTHVQIGADILAQSNVPHLKMAEEIARFHHEHWDGGGYPFGLAYSAIPIAARIAALADAFDELTHARAHEQARPPQDALHEIASERGKQFDPELTDLFLELVPRLQLEYGDLDAYLGQAARESSFIQARRKIASTLKAFSESAPIERR